MVQLIDRYYERELSINELNEFFYLTPEERTTAENAEKIIMHMRTMQGVCDIQIEFITPLEKE